MLVLGRVHYLIASKSTVHVSIWCLEASSWDFLSISNPDWFEAILIPRWRFFILFYNVHPELWGRFPTSLIVFLDGWPNHKLDFLFARLRHCWLMLIAPIWPHRSCCCEINAQEFITLFNMVLRLFEWSIGFVVHPQLSIMWCEQYVLATTKELASLLANSIYLLSSHETW